MLSSSEARALVTRAPTARVRERLVTVASDVRPPADKEWRAITAWDRRFDGRFVWAATSTSVYCRPSCPARRPRRCTVLVLSTAAVAERQGYFSCARCHPEADASFVEGQSHGSARAHSRSPRTGAPPSDLVRPRELEPDLLPPQEKRAGLRVRGCTSSVTPSAPTSR